ncbi:caspase domain-containing protein [Maribacter chungangensis]|uniref:Caspase domain-containing protein n=1 Tax=Maribacter chungangensis TaxID=1069117 RepID=A0ABW3B332_9FLAO
MQIKLSVNFYTFLALALIQVSTYANVFEYNETPLWMRSGESFLTLSGGNVLNCNWNAVGANNIDTFNLNFNIRDFDGQEKKMEFDYLEALTKLSISISAENLENLIPIYGGFSNSLYFATRSYIFKLELDLAKPHMEVIYKSLHQINNFKVYEDFYIVAEKSALKKIAESGEVLDLLEIDSKYSNFYLNHLEDSKKVSIAYTTKSNKRIYELYSFEDKFTKLRYSESEVVLGILDNSKLVLGDQENNIKIVDYKTDKILKEFNFSHLPKKLGNCQKITSDNNYYYMFFTSYEYSEVLKIQKNTGLIVQRLGSNFDFSKIEKDYCENCLTVTGNYSFQIPYLILENKLYNINNHLAISGTDFPKITISNSDNTKLEFLETTNSTFYIKGHITSTLTITEYKIEKVRETKNIGYLGEDNIRRDTVSFSTKIELFDDLNFIKISATDALFNKSVKDFTIKKLPKKSRGSIASGQLNLEETIESFEYKALLISNQNYLNGVEKLKFPNQDASNLKAVLKNKYSFKEKNIFHLKDASRDDIINSLDSLANVISTNDNLLIFYAGHGVFDENIKKGYWLPVNADPKRKTNWVSNSDIRDYLVSFKSQHTLLISDACFSGSIFEFGKRELTDKSKTITEKLLKKKSRKAMTSGLNKSVPDKSQFIKYLLKELEENKNSYLTAGQLFSQMREAILANTDNNPQFEIIKNANHEGGEFVFLRSDE